MRTGIAFTLVFGLLLSFAPGTARAGGRSIYSGSMQVNVGETVDCAATNVSTRTLTNIRITIRDFQGDPATAATLCQSIEPLASCAGAYSPGVNRHVFCEATSDQGAKGLRATLLNIDTGAASDAR